MKKVMLGKAYHECNIYKKIEWHPWCGLRGNSWLGTNRKREKERERGKKTDDGRSKIFSLVLIPTTYLQSGTKSNLHLMHIFT
jgi:hypothetical protein